MKFTNEQRRTWLASLDRRFSSAAVLIENEQGELLIVKSNYKDHWSLPGGIVDPGESPLEALGIFQQLHTREWPIKVYRSYLSCIKLRWQFL